METSTHVLHKSFSGTGYDLFRLHVAYVSSSAYPPPLIKPPSKTTCVYPSRSCIIILVPSSFFPSAHCHGFSPSFRSFGRRKEQLAVNQADDGRSTTLLQIRSLPPPPPSLHLRIRRPQLVRELTTVQGMSYQVLLPRQ